MKGKRLSVGVVGSGVAGLVAAHILDREHAVTIMEKNEYIGGHTHTLTVDRGPDRGVPVDTGFIVMNHRTYPLLTRLFEKLGVALRDSDMSFGYYCERSGLQYSSRGFNGFFAQRRNLLSRAHYRMLSDLLRFHREAKRDLLEGRLSALTLKEYLSGNGYCDDFVTHHIIPMGAAVWSTRFDVMMEFPASTFVRFLHNHGLMGFRDRPRWRTVAGGSHTYVRRILQEFRGDVMASCPVKSVARTKAGVTVTLAGGSKKKFDRVIIATHADEALKLLADPSPDEKKLLGPWRYEKNRTVLHHDQGVMPPRTRAWASWNFTRENAGSGQGPCP
jgi:predicted NAD/FAD-binding protein